ncbi:hypothetical protein ABZ281_17780 [Streptomyces sp. NPDC006265]|uniref:hypothetical protein n=1 Tax=Streptomyces sp. NPDC006265 TaxID=3156740 RepID=UPI0033B9FAE5
MADQVDQVGGPEVAVAQVVADRLAGQGAVRRQALYQFPQVPQGDAALEERPQRAALPVLRVLVAQVGLDGPRVVPEDV